MPMMGKMLFFLETSDPVDTPTVEKSKLDTDPQGKEVYPIRYHGMIGSLMYLTANTDHAGCQDTRRSTSGSMQLLGDRLNRISAGRDIFTKALGRERLDFLINKLGMRTVLILDICLRVEGEEFTKVQDDATLTFLIDLGYKGPLHKYTNMYLDHMHQPWRTLAAIINKCLSRKTASNDRLRKSKINILWGMFYRENVDYPELIWEDIAFQINHKKEKRSRLKFVRIGEDYQEYGLPIPDMMLNDKIKQSESYQMFNKYSTGLIPPKKSRGKDSQGKKTVDTTEATIDVSEESYPEPARKQEAARLVHATHARIVTESVPEPARRRPPGIAFRDTSRVSKKVSSDPSQKLKGVQSLTLEEQEATDTMQALKESKKTSRRQPGTGGSSEGTGRIPVVPDESIVFSATSSEGTGTNPGVPNAEKVTSESNVILEWGSKQESEYSEEDQRDDEEVNWIDSDEDDEKKDDADDDKSIDLEMTDEEETNDEFVHGDEQLNNDEDEEMTNDEVEDSRKGDAKISDVAKADAEKIEEIKDDSKKAEVPPISSSLYICSGFGDQFLKLSYHTSLVSTLKDTTDAEINLLLDIKIQYESSVLTHIPETPSVALATTLITPSFISTIPPIPHQTTSPIPTPPITTDAPTITTAVPESNALTDVKLEKDVFELKKIDHSVEALATLKSHVLMVVEHHLGSKIGDDLQKVLQRHTADLIQKYSMKPAPKSSKIQKPTIDLEQESKKSASDIRKIKREQSKKEKMPKYTIKSTDKAALKEYDQKSALYQTMHENKSFNRNPVNHALYHALMKALIEDDDCVIV
ncbi:hypothetical protein Tco_0649566 [Tanacetum coccineum]